MSDRATIHGSTNECLQTLADHVDRMKRTANENFAIVMERIDALEAKCAAQQKRIEELEKRPLWAPPTWAAQIDTREVDRSPYGGPNITCGLAR